jgi:hypothetical protein
MGNFVAEFFAVGAWRDRGWTRSDSVEACQAKERR